MKQELQKHMDFTEEEINNYLREMKALVVRKKFKISDKNREENVNFIQKYQLSEKKQQKMLLDLDIADFAYAVDNYKNNNEVLYVFGKIYELNDWGDYKKVPVYIKINIIKDDSNKGFCIIVSFHQLEKNLKLLFNGNILEGDKNVD
ncbi:MAG: hypothetical protein J6A36_00270 [Clostridia bacterium]|nr:hypothetical protein [Clostridia bacterium]